MESISSRLSAYATGLRFDDIPDHVVLAAKASIIDTVGVCAFGSTLAWSRMVSDYARQSGGAGAATIIGTGLRTSSSMAALANGASAHGFEMDNLRQPSAGVHAGSTIVPALLGVAEEEGASGEDVLVAFVAACEIMSRIGVAADNTAERLGFHSPGLTGTFGAAIASGCLLGLSQSQMTSALGVAGSLCSGLLAFSKAGNGGMVKRLHTGRAAEGGVMAAKLGKSGFTGPDVIFEGQFGFFEAFTRNSDVEKVTANLGSHWEIEKIAIKCFPFHVTAHTPVQTFLDIRYQTPFEGDEIEEIVVASSEKVMSHHVLYKANDIASVQYSLPFCLATSAYRDPADPKSFLDDPHRDDRILDLVKRIRVSLNPESLPPGPAWATSMSVRLKDGRTLDGKRTDFLGTPSNPMSDDQLDQKFIRIAGDVFDDARAVIAHYRQIEKLQAFRALP